MKLRFEDKKGNRFKSQFSHFSPVNSVWFWNCNLKKWTQKLEPGKYEYSGWRDCKSVRAFRRMLKTAPKGVKFELSNKYQGVGNVYGFGSYNNYDI